MFCRKYSQIEDWGFVCFLFSSFGWHRLQEGRDTQALKTGAKSKFLIQKVTSINKKTIGQRCFGKKKKVIVIKIKTEGTAQQIKLKKTDIVTSVMELKSHFLCSYIISPSLFFKWPFWCLQCTPASLLLQLLQHSWVFCTWHCLFPMFLFAWEVWDCGVFIEN